MAHEFMVRCNGDVQSGSLGPELLGGGTRRRGEHILGALERRRVQFWLQSCYREFDRALRWMEAVTSALTQPVETARAVRC
jgi:hypothetical protein